MRRRATQPVGHTRRGITLVEVVLSSLVLSFVATGAVRLLVAVVDRRESSVRDSAGSQLAEQMLAEAMARPFESPAASRNAEFGRSVAEDGASGWGAFDDCDDFDGWSASPPESGDGTTIVGLDGWTRRARVDWVTTADLNTAAAGPTDVKRITVVAEYQGRPVATRVGYRSWAGQRTVEEP